MMSQKTKVSEQISIIKSDDGVFDLVWSNMAHILFIDVHDLNIFLEQMVKTKKLSEEDYEKFAMVLIVETL